MRLQSQTPPEVNPLVRCWNLRSRLTVVRTCSVSAPDLIAFVSADPMKSALSRRWPYIMTVSFLNSRSQLVHPKDTLMHPQHDKKKILPQIRIFCRIFVALHFFVMRILGKKFDSPNKGSDCPTTCLNALPLSYRDSQK